jgi:hypothetical protein
VFYPSVFTKKFPDWLGETPASALVVVVKATGDNTRRGTPANEQK